MRRDPLEIRVRLQDARLILLLSPELALGRDPLTVLEAVLPWIDVVQIRPKLTGAGAPTLGPCSARETWTLCRRILASDAVRRAGTLVTVDDRLDVARALWDEGCAGAHVGQDDTPAAEARAFLGADPLLGLSTHDLAQVGAAEDLPVDYLGFGPVNATGTKGYARGLGPEACWIAAQGSAWPLFAIGGVGVENAHELARVGRAAVGSAILSAEDPAAAARALRAALEGAD